MTEEEEAQKKLTLSINMEEKLSAGADSRKNFGYAAILKIFHELGLDVFFKNKSRHEHFEYNTNPIMIMLVVSRLLCPGSKKKALEIKNVILNVSTSLWQMFTGLFPTFLSSLPSSKDI